MIDDWFSSPAENTKNHHDANFFITGSTPDSKVHWANMEPTWVLSAPDGPRDGPRNLVIRDDMLSVDILVFSSTVSKAPNTQGWELSSVIDTNFVTTVTKLTSWWHSDYSTNDFPISLEMPFLYKKLLFDIVQLRQNDHNFPHNIF